MPKENAKQVDVIARALKVIGMHGLVCLCPVNRALGYFVLLASRRIVARQYVEFVES
jgi:hypothetical protein